VDAQLAVSGALAVVLLIASALLLSNAGPSGPIRDAQALVGALLVLELARIRLAASLTRRLRRARRERRLLMQRATDASEQERKRIARDLHDGVVQNLVGASYQLAAAAEQAGAGASRSEVRAAVEQAASETRRSIRELRTLLVDVYPPDLQRDGLEAALIDGMAPLASRGIDWHLRVAPDLRLPAHANAVLFRAAAESLRNVARHSQATNVWVTVDGRGRGAGLTVEDDGRGFDPSQVPGPREGRHFGLRILEELAREADGELTVESAPGQGTRLYLRVPRP
jgi:signal transduction histidine kinase